MDSSYNQYARHLKHNLIHKFKLNRDEVKHYLRQHRQWLKMQYTLGVNPVNLARKIRKEG